MKRLLRRAGELPSLLLLSVLYVVFWIPVGLVTQYLADWLHRRPPFKSNWWHCPARLNDPHHVQQPF